MISHKCFLAYKWQQRDTLGQDDILDPSTQNIPRYVLRSKMTNQNLMCYVHPSSNVLNTQQCPLSPQPQTTKLEITCIKKERN